MQLSTVDLNLLVVLDAVLRTGSVKAASALLHLSPSATSHALARLRETFDDPLFVRAGRALVPTARAEALAPAVRSALSAVHAVYARRDAVDPAALRRAFTVLTTDYGHLVLVQPASVAIAAEAPGVDVWCLPTTGDAVGALRSGRADVAIGVYRDGLPPDVVRRHLFDERFACLVRRGHPALAGDGLTLDRYCAADHLLIAPAGDNRGIVDDRLDALGRARRVARTVPGFLVAPHFVAGTDLVLTISARLAHRFAATFELEIAEPPLDLPGYAISMLWHERAHDDPAHAWFRGVVGAT